jgi:hypothetical protein
VHVGDAEVIVLTSSEHAARGGRVGRAAGPVARGAPLRCGGRRRHCVRIGAPRRASATTTTTTRRRPVDSEQGGGERDTDDERSDTPTGVNPNAAGLRLTKLHKTYVARGREPFEAVKGSSWTSGRVSWWRCSGRRAAARPPRCA